MDGFSKNKSQVLVVHCVDTEGPIGGDVRRKPDGSKEFMDSWKDIKKSLSEILIAFLVKQPILVKKN